MAKVTIGVLRALGAALDTYQGNMIGTEPSKKEIRDFNQAVRWFRQQCKDAGVEMFPYLSEED